MKVALIISFVIVFILLILVLVFRKIIWLKSIQIRYGKYSHQYVKRFKKLTNKNPFPYCFKDDIMPYLRLSFRPNNESLVYRTSNPVLFENTPFSSLRDDVFTQNAKPYCFNIFRISNQELSAYGFINDHISPGAKTVFFFLNDGFCMGEYIIENINEQNVLDISKKLLSDFRITGNLSALCYFIEDDLGRRIYFYENGFTLTIRYFEPEGIMKKMLT
jgi:hypothetical protein